ncbi:MAG: hypothetical protein ACRDZZ_04960 [Ilumatobacteraceae bacterium]
MIAGAGVVYALEGRYGARGWCHATASVRAELADAVADLDDAEAIFVAQVAVANEKAPDLVARADRMVWPRGDLADQAAAALVDVAGAEIAGGQRAPLLRFIELDNQFRDEHCDSRPAGGA